MIMNFLIVLLAALLALCLVLVPSFRLPVCLLRLSSVSSPAALALLL